MKEFSFKFFSKKSKIATYFLSNSIRTVIFLLLFFAAAIINAQPPNRPCAEPPCAGGQGGGNPCPIPPCVPIDQGLGLLLIGGAIVGGIYFKKLNKS